MWHSTPANMYFIISDKLRRRYYKKNKNTASVGCENRKCTNVHTFRSAGSHSVRRKELQKKRVLFTCCFCEFVFLFLICPKMLTGTKSGSLFLYTLWISTQFKVTQSSFIPKTCCRVYFVHARKSSAIINRESVFLHALCTEPCCDAAWWVWALRERTGAEHNSWQVTEKLLLDITAVYQFHIIDEAWKMRLNTNGWSSCDSDSQNIYEAKF